MIVHLNHPIPDIIRLKTICNINQIKLHDTGTESRKEAHDFWEFLFLASGNLNILVDGELYTLSPGDLILYPPHSFHSVAMSRGAVAVCVSFATESSLLSTLTDRILLLREDARQKVFEMLELKEKIFTNAKGASVVKDITFRGMVLRKDANPADFQKLANLLEIFLLDLCNADARNQNNRFQSREFAAFTAYLRENIDRSLSLEEISAECALSASHLQKLCHDHCGCGPITYFIALKIGMAKQLMQEETLNFTEIAERLGFSSVHYFSKLFKSKTGMSPTEYALSVSERR